MHASITIGKIKLQLLADAHTKGPKCVKRKEKMKDKVGAIWIASNSIENSQSSPIAIEFYNAHSMFYRSILSIRAKETVSFLKKKTFQ